MDMFLYLNKGTVIHRLDPRTKLIFMLGSFIIALSYASLVILVLILAAVLIYGAIGRSLSNLKRIRFILIMLAIVSLLLWSFNTENGATVLFGPVVLEGVIKGAGTALKFGITLISGMIFLSTTKIEEISLGLVKLKMPYKGAFAFATGIRLVPMIVGTSYTIMQAQKSRGLDLDSGSFYQKVKKYIPLLVPTFISVIRGTNVFSMALESKGFGCEDVRTNYLVIKCRAKDYITITLIIGLVVFSILANILNLIPAII